MTTPAPALSDGTMPCPVPSPHGAPCTKTIPAGWTADEGHGGGHFWATSDAMAMLRSGHYDAAAALAGLPFASHEPDECRPGCPRWWGAR